MSESILLLGATSAVARALAHRLAKVGHYLLLAGRDPIELERDAANLRLRHRATVSVCYFEALDFASHPAFFAECLAHCPNGLYGAIACHGVQVEQAAAISNLSEARRMMDANYTSIVSIFHLAADHMEKRGVGFLCALSSVAGDRGRQSNYVYGATKAALNTFLDGLRNRLAPKGVHVLTVKPGFVDTRLTWGLPGLFLVAQPERVAEDIHRALGRQRDVLYSPWFWRPLMGVIRAIPERFFKKFRL
ncbi:MAG: SDR family oxidoreductase [Gemmataceae bacterium]|nr:SDR family oxidoreductase [Gemmataceae bacterium]